MFALSENRIVACILLENASVKEKKISFLRRGLVKPPGKMMTTVIDNS